MSFKYSSDIISSPNFAHRCIYLEANCPNLRLSVFVEKPCCLSLLLKFSTTLFIDSLQIWQNRINWDT